MSQPSGELLRISYTRYAGREPQSPRYFRIDAAGSTRVARATGTYEAIRETAPRSAVTATNVPTSLDSTP
jgi:hypothetical protein